MTYLETLVRILPRQRRAFEEQRKLGLWSLLAGLVLATITAVVTHDDTLTGMIAFAWVAPVFFIFYGGYRITRAEILIADNQALAAAVIECRQEERERRDAKASIHLVIADEIQRARMRTMRGKG